jgi:hypothetical protein
MGEESARIARSIAAGFTRFVSAYGWRRNEPALELARDMVRLRSGSGSIAEAE